MSPRLRMYNVEFGDAFLLLGRREHLLVDLGSIDGRVDFDPIRDDIRAACSGATLSLLLTHFHKDHWSGLRNQPSAHSLPPIRTVYLPDIFGLRVPGRQDALVDSLLGELLEAVILDRAPEFTLAELLRQILPAVGGRVSLLRRGVRFTLDDTDYEVLWPRLEPKDITRRRRAAFLRFLEQLERRVEGPPEEGVWYTVNALADVLLRDFAARMDLPRQLELFSEQGPDYQVLYRQAALLVRQLRLAYVSDAELRRGMHYYARTLQEDWNKVSLVFHNCMPCPEGTVLMTGDVPGRVLRRQADGRYGPPFFREDYRIIKAPHHGTDSHFCDRLPPCEFLCISNGGGNSRFQKISRSYEGVYGVLGRRTVLHCTNDRCEYSAGGFPCPGAGGCGQSSTDI